MPRRAAEGSSEVERALERMLRLTANRTVHARQSVAAGVAVSRPGYAILRCLDDAGGLSLGEVARACSADPAAIGRQVKALEDEGFVERTASATDGRVSVVRLTDAGRSAFEQVSRVRAKHMEEVLAGWAPADRHALAGLLNRLVDDMKATPMRPAGSSSRSITRRSA
jgi:DNA-binding MarR family transcriptional regulator